MNKCCGLFRNMPSSVESMERGKTEQNSLCCSLSLLLLHALLLQPVLHCLEFPLLQHCRTLFQELHSPLFLLPVRLFLTLSKDQCLLCSPCVCSCLLLGPAVSSLCLLNPTGFGSLLLLLLLPMGVLLWRGVGGGPFMRTDSGQRNMACRHRGVWRQLRDGAGWEVFVRQPRLHTSRMQTETVSITWHQHTWGCKCSFPAVNSTCFVQTAAQTEANATCSKKQECSCQYLVLEETAKAFSCI